MISKQWEEEEILDNLIAMREIGKINRQEYGYALRIVSLYFRLKDEQ